MLNPPTDLETAWCTWAYIFINICNMYVPMKKYRVELRNNPWMTDHILELMYKHDYAHKQWVKNPERLWLHEYKKLRNSVTSNIKLAKSFFVKNGISRATGNTRKTWNVLKAALNQNTYKPISPSLTADNLNDYLFWCRAC